MLRIKSASLLLFIAVIMLAQTGYAQLTNTSRRTIVVMGSSSAYGWKSSVQDSAWVYKLQKDLHFYGRGDTVIDIAYPGNTSYICLPTGSTHPPYAPGPNTDQNVTKALSYNPTFVIISLPTNDIADGYSDSETLANYTKITNALDAAHVPYILTGTQPRDLATDSSCGYAFDGNYVCLSTGALTPAEQADLGTFNALLAAQYPLNGTYNTPIVNNFLTLLSVSSTNFEINPAIGYGDGIHYGDAGHRIVYNTFLSFQLYKDLVNFTQTISFTLSPKAIGTADFDPGATSNFSLPITYTSNNTAVATITSGGLIHLVGTGTATITATQAGDTHHLPATTTATLTCTAPSSTTYDWIGGVSTAWNNPNNWQSTTGSTMSNPASDYPGDQQSTDQVNIGVNVNYTNNPEVTATPPNLVSSITFGDRLITGGATATNTLTVDNLTILNVSGQILQKHTTAGVLNSGNTATTAVRTYLQGSGTINCGSFAIGDSTTPTADSVVNITQVTMGAAAGGSHITMNISGDLNLNTQSRDNAGNTLVVSNNNAQFSLSQGILTIGGHINLTDGGANNFNRSLFKPEALFSMDLHNNADSTTLNLQSANALTSQSGNIGNKFDFYNVVQPGGTGIATVNYNGSGNQEVYNYILGASVNNYIDNIGTDASDIAVYQNLSFGGSGTKTVDGPSTQPTLIVSQDVTLDAGTEIVDLSTNNSALLMGADFNSGTGSTLNCGTRPFIVNGSFYNNGNCNFGTAMVTFNAGGGENMYTANNCLLTNVTFTGDGTETMMGGNFFLTSQGVLNINSNAQLVANGHLTLNSDSTGSATVAAIPAGCSITGKVNVKRYVSNHRAYRLASSPVYNATTGSNNIFSIKYLTRAIYTTGSPGPAGGFDKGGNPTLYLYREDLAPQYSTFVNSNFRGISNITDSLNYSIDLDGGPFNLPVGNGFMFYFRGSRNQASLAALTTAGALATTDTLVAVGTLNQGAVTVSNWYTPSSANLGWTTNSGNVAIEGSNLVGNPYASSIDWDQYSTSNPSAGIYAPNVAPFAYQLIPSGAQGSGNYGVYTAGHGGNDGVNGATNIIGSGVGFFVQADTVGAQLVFNENAKTNTQAVVGSTLFMGTPVNTAINDQFIRLQMAKDSINTDESIIRFDNAASTVFNYRNDARYRSGTGLVSLSTISSDNVALAINRVPFPKNKQELVIPLKVSASNNGNYSMKVATINQVPQLYDVLLADAYAKDSVNMRTNASYSFAINKSDTATLGSKRFSIVIRENPTYVYKLVSFTGKSIEHRTQTQLNWTTVNEQNYTNFTVERSIDNGKTFNVIGGLTASDLGAYGLVDKNPIIGQDIYRLRQVDIDGNISYSNNVNVSIIDRSNRAVCLYPNPTKNTINLSINTKTADAGAYKILVSNSSGIIVRTAISAHPFWQSNVSDLLTGTYLIQVLNQQDDSLVGEAKFVKL